MPPTRTVRTRASGLGPALDPLGPPRSAVVLSSGGAKGAYQLGVLKALFSGASPATGYRKLDPDIYTGSSIGAFNGTYLTAQTGVSAEAALDRLIHVWRRQIAQTPLSCGNGFARLRGLPLQGGQIGCLLRPWEVATDMASDSLALSRDALEWTRNFLSSSLPIESRILDTVDLSDFIDPTPLYRLVESVIDRAGLARSPKALEIVTARWRDGATRLFSRPQLAVRGDVRPVLASMAIPGVLPEVNIDGEWYVDGALTMPTPLKPAIQAGADDLHVIFLDPLLIETEVSPEAGTFETMMRVFNILSAHRMRHDIEFAALVNRGLEILRGLFVDGATDTEVLAALGRIPDIVERLRSGPPRRRLTIHRYRPGPDLGAATDYLDFRLSAIDRFMEIGFRDAVDHDCERHNCVLADARHHPHLESRGTEWATRAARGWSA